MSALDEVALVDHRAFRSDSASARQEFIDCWGRSIEWFGFARVVGHDVHMADVMTAYSYARTFFLLEQSRKDRSRSPTGDDRGYNWLGREHAKDGAAPDLKEFYHVVQEVERDHRLARFYARRPNIFPREVPGFAFAFHKLFRALEAASLPLLEATALYLGREPDHFTRLATAGNHVLRVIRYPRLSDFFVPNGIRSAQHEDINLITLLPTATEAGLQLLHDGQWIDVNAERGELIVDTGDTMHFLCPRLPATTHRVVNPAEDNERFSMPFFFHPDPDAILVSDDPSRAPIREFDFTNQRLHKIGVLKEPPVIGAPLW